jgi:hypothetical protein
MYPEEDVAAEQGKTSRRVPSWRIVKGKFLGTMAPSPFSFRIVHVEFCSRIMPVMNIREAAPANRPARNLGVTGRIASIDIFRGLTVLVMVFVDNLDFVKGLPWWTYQMPRQTNGLTSDTGVLSAIP